MNEPVGTVVGNIDGVDVCVGDVWICRNKTLTTILGYS